MIRLNKNKGISLPTTLFSLVAIAVAIGVIVKYGNTTSNVNYSLNEKGRVTAVNECISTNIVKLFQKRAGTDPTSDLTNDLISSIPFYRPNFFIGAQDINSETGWSEGAGTVKYSTVSGVSDPEISQIMTSCANTGGSDVSQISLKVKLNRMCRFPGETSGNVAGGVQECQQIAGTGTSTASSSLGYNSYNYTTNFTTNAVIYKLYTQVILNPVGSNGDEVGKKSAMSASETVFSF